MNDPRPAVDEGEVIRTPLDKRAAGTGFPGEGYRRRTKDAPGRAVLWHSPDNNDFEPAPAPQAAWGAFPQRFLSFAIKALGSSPSCTLHVCSGALDSSAGGVRVDIRSAARPDVQADGRALPFRDGSFDGVLLDPPYSPEYAEALYQTDYPRPSHLLREAARVVREGGRVAMLHFLIPSPAGSGLKLLRVLPVTQGCGYRIRALTVYVRPHAPGLL